MEQLEVGCEAVDEFGLGAAEGRAIVVVDHVVDGEEVAAGTEAGFDGSGVSVAVGGIDGAIERVFEDPVEGGFRGGLEEVVGAPGDVEPFGAGFFFGEAEGGGGEVEAGDGEAVPGPAAGVVAGAAAGDEDGAAGEFGVVVEEVGETG